MQITLKINDKDKTFTNDFVKARVFRNALKLNEQIREKGNEITAATFDEMISFVVSVFDNKFTVDEVWDGLEASKLQSEITRIFYNVLNIGGIEANSVDPVGK